MANNMAFLFIVLGYNFITLDLTANGMTNPLLRRKYESWIEKIVDLPCLWLHPLW
jgi:hypothetical protein